MRLSAGAWRWLIVPTTQSKSAWRGEKRGASAPKRAMSKRGLAIAMNSMAQQAVTYGYWKSEYFFAQFSSASTRVVANPTSPLSIT